MKTQNHMCPTLQTCLCRQGQHLQGGLRKSDSGSEDHCREVWNETNREGKDEKIRKVRINRGSGWGVLFNVERWSWGHRRKGRPYMGRGTMRLKWYISRAQTLISQEEIYGYVTWGTLCLHTLIQRWKWVWTTSIHFPWHWMKSTETIKRRCSE